MNGNLLTAKAQLAGEKMMFLCESGGYELCSDYIPPYGDGQGFMPLQLFLVSLSACMGGTIQFLSKKMQRHVGALTVTAQGERRTQHPTMFGRILLDIRVTSDNMSDGDMQDILAQAEETFCPVAAMIKGNVPLEMTFEISRG